MKQLIFLALLAHSILAYGQNKERFEGESELQECEVKVDLYYSTKRNADLMKSVERFKDKQLVLLTVDKKKGTTYTYYYLIGTKTSLGPTAYLIEPKFLDENQKERFFLFLDYKPKKHIFYDAECFQNIPSAEKLVMKTFEKGQLRKE